MTSPRDLVVVTENGKYATWFDVEGVDNVCNDGIIRVLPNDGSLGREGRDFAVICMQNQAAGQPASPDKTAHTCLFMTRDQLHAAMFAIAMALSNGDDA